MRSLVNVLSALLLVSSAWCEDVPAKSVDAAQTARAAAVVDLMNFEEAKTVYLNASFDTMMDSARKSVPAAQAAAFDAAVTEMKELLLKKIDAATMKKAFINSYAQIFSGDELVQLKTFGQTPVGQHFINSVPNLGAAFDKVVQTEIAKSTTELQQIFAKHMSGAADQEHEKLGIIVGKPFPTFTATTLDGKPFDLASWKGKVVLVDFWATWCGPCMGEMPNVKKDYESYHAKGFEIIGVSLDSDKNALTKCLADNAMTWPQIFDGKGWHAALAEKFGITSIPAPFLIGRDGTLIAQGLRGSELEDAIAKALGSADVPAP